jgi:hypothetical protein
MVGTYLAYCKILPLSIEFLKSAAFKPEGVDFLLDYRKSLAFISQMMIAFLALFQLPLVLLILMALDVVKRQTLLRFSRYIIVLIFVLAALLTPPRRRLAAGLGGALDSALLRDYLDCEDLRLRQSRRRVIGPAVQSRASRCRGPAPGIVFRPCPAAVSWPLPISVSIVCKEEHEDAGHHRDSGYRRGGGPAFRSGADPEICQEYRQGQA